MQKTIESINPANLEILGSVTCADTAQVHSAVSQAKVAQASWQNLGFQKRRQYLLAFRDLVLQEIEGLAKMISQENGKPIIEAIGNDILPVLDLITYFANHSEKLLKKEKIKLGKWSVMGRKSHLEFYPYGVVGVISPWNFPFSIPVGEVAMALMAGNTVVLKPSEHTPLIAEKVKTLFEKIQLPENVFQILQGDGAIGAELVNSRVDKIVFTGSVATGKRIMEACAKTLKPLTLELGGKDPMLVFADADLDVASSAAVWGAFCNSGQVCASVERVYVEESAREVFTNFVLEKTKSLRQNHSQFDVDVGAMTLSSQLDKVVEQVEAARAQGARILSGGKKPENAKGYFYEPTVITNVDHNFAVVNEETFGPVLPIMTFQNEDEAIQKANASDYALNAYVWTKDRSKAHRVASQLIAGTVNINESLFTHALPQTPWGGVKDSGLGRTHGALGLLDLVQVRHVHENKRPTKKNFFWWYGYSEEKIQLLKLLSTSLFGKGWGRVKAFVKFVRLSMKVKVR